MDLQFDVSFDVELETIIASTTMTYIKESNLYELHPMYEGVFNVFMIDK